MKTIKYFVVPALILLALLSFISVTESNDQKSKQALLRGVQADDVALVKKMLDKGVGMGKLDDDLLFEVKSPAMAELLFSHGLHANGRDTDGETALMEVCRNVGNPSETARVLLEHGADPNAHDNSGKTALMVAGDAATLEVLLAHGADIKAKDNDGHGVLEALMYGDPNALDVLILHHAPFDPRTDGPRLLAAAADYKQSNFLTYLLDNGVDPNQYEDSAFSPLANAAGSGNYNAAKLLIDRGARIQSPAMGDAVANGHMDIARLFWEHGCRDLSELTYAISQGKPVEEIQHLLDQGASPNRSRGEDCSPLELAAQMDRLDVVKLLVQRGASLNAESAPEQSFISIVAAAGQDDIVEYLLSQGIKPDLDSLSEAAMNSNPAPGKRQKIHYERTVKLLLDAGVVKAIPEDKASIPLLSAIDTYGGGRGGDPNGNPAVLKMLLDAGLSPEAPMTIYLSAGKTMRVPFITEYRNEYQSAKGQAEDAQWAAGFKPFMDLLEDADAKWKSRPKNEAPAK